MRTDQVLDDAIAATADAWRDAAADGSIPGNINLRDRVTLFAPRMKKTLFKLYPQLRSAGDQVLLLVVAEGIAQSGSVPRETLEKDSASFCRRLANDRFGPIEEINAIDQLHEWLQSASERLHADGY